MKSPKKNIKAFQNEAFASKLILTLLCGIWLFVSSESEAKSAEPLQKVGPEYWLVNGAGLYHVADLCSISTSEDDKSVLESVIFSSIAVANLANPEYRKYSVEDLANEANDRSYEIEQNFLGFADYLLIIQQQHQNNELDCETAQKDLTAYLAKARNEGVAVTAQAVAMTLARGHSAKSLFRQVPTRKGGV